jgi:hypothetical protein
VHRNLPADRDANRHRSECHFGEMFGEISIGVHDVFSVKGLIKGCGARGMEYICGDVKTYVAGGGVS